MSDDGYLARPNEYFMLRRAARRLIERLFTSEAYWDRPDEINAVRDSVVLLRQCAMKIELKWKKRRWYWA